MALRVAAPPAQLNVIIALVVVVVMRALGYGWVVSLALAYAGTMFDGSSKRGDRRWGGFQYWSGWRRLFESYFSATLVVERQPDGTPAIDRAGQYIFALHPHGVGSIAHVMYMTDAVGFLSRVFPARRRLDLAASVTFLIPFFRELLLWFGCVDASRPVAEKFLRKKISLMVYPGGEREQLRTQYGRECVVLSKSHGFIRLALKHGIPVVPIYTFGETKLYRTSSLFMGLRRWLVARLRVCVMLATGAYGTPWPLAHRLVGVVGRPLDLGHVPSPTQEQVLAAHEKYVVALRELFDRHKAAYCECKDKTLHVE